MSKTVALVRLTDSAITISINGSVPRSMDNPNNLIVKPTSDGNGAIVKISDESWRQYIDLTDTVTEGGVTKSPFGSQAALVADLQAFFHN